MVTSAVDAKIIPDINNNVESEASSGQKHPQGLAFSASAGPAAPPLRLNFFRSSSPEVAKAFQYSGPQSRWADRGNEYLKKPYAIARDVTHLLEELVPGLREGKAIGNTAARIISGKESVAQHIEELQDLKLLDLNAGNFLVDLLVGGTLLLSPLAYRFLSKLRKGSEVGASGVAGSELAGSEVANNAERVVVEPSRLPEHVPETFPESTLILPPGSGLHIAEVAPLYESVPPLKYGGTERVIYDLIPEFVAKGHHVTLYASGDSVTAAQHHVKWVEKAIWRTTKNPDLPNSKQLHFDMMKEVEERALRGDFSVVHNHLDFPHLQRPLGNRYPNVTTVHGYQGDPAIIPFHAQYGGMNLVSISNRQRHALEGGNWIGTVYHGMPTNRYTLGQGGDRLAFLGRFSPDKGAPDAIQIALKSELPIELAAKASEPAQFEYYTKFVKPLLDKAGPSNARWIDEVDDAQKQVLLGNARALVFPIQWEEPFGLVMIEAGFCGTPVVAYRWGSVSEVIKDGVNGFVVNSIPEAVAAVHAAKYLNRETVRQYTIDNFSASKMAEGYIRIFEELKKVDLRDRSRYLH